MTIEYTYIDAGGAARAPVTDNSLSTDASGVFEGFVPVANLLSSEGAGSLHPLKVIQAPAGRAELKAEKGVSWNT